MFSIRSAMFGIAFGGLCVIGSAAQAAPLQAAPIGQAMQDDATLLQVRQGCGPFAGRNRFGRCQPLRSTGAYGYRRPYYRGYGYHRHYGY